MKTPIFPGKYHQNGGFSMAMLVYRRVLNPYFWWVYVWGGSHHFLTLGWSKPQGCKSPSMKTFHTSAFLLGGTRFDELGEAPKNRGSTDVVDLCWFQYEVSKSSHLFEKSIVLTHGNHFRFLHRNECPTYSVASFVVELHFTSLLPAGYWRFVVWVQSHGSWSFWNKLCFSQSRALWAYQFDFSWSKWNKHIFNEENTFSKVF